MLAGAGDRLLREHNDRAWAAWHTAWLTAYAPQKPGKFPKLDKMLSRGPRKRQTADQQMALVRAWLGDGKAG